MGPQNSNRNVGKYLIFPCAPCPYCRCYPMEGLSQWVIWISSECMLDCMFPLYLLPQDLEDMMKTHKSIDVMSLWIHDQTIYRGQVPIVSYSYLKILHTKWSFVHLALETGSSQVSTSFLEYPNDINSSSCHTSFLETTRIHVARIIIAH